MAAAELNLISNGFKAGFVESVEIDKKDGGLTSSILFSPQVPTESTESVNGEISCELS